MHQGPDRGVRLTDLRAHEGQTGCGLQALGCIKGPTGVCGLQALVCIMVPTGVCGLQALSVHHGADRGVRLTGLRVWADRGVRLTGLSVYTGPEGGPKGGEHRGRRDGLRDGGAARTRVKVRPQL